MLDKAARTGESVADDADWLPKKVDKTRPSAARVYDFILGGSYNLEVDRRLGREISKSIPHAVNFMRLNRAFLRRAVTYLVDQGITQFLDIGSGLPSVGNVHEIAQKVNPDCRVVYVDNELVAVHHCHLLLKGNPHAIAIEGDLRQPAKILENEQVRQMLDFSKPIGLLMVAVFHFIAEADDPCSLLAYYRDMLPAGSYLTLSHGTADTMPKEAADLVELYKNSQNPLTVRTKAQFIKLFTGFDLVEPGVVFTPQWHPDDPRDVGEHPEHSAIYAAVGRKMS